tara:strand:+ start:8646 stop:9035 length:390 start_codon:yes stop_codon:yes gene_type:complete
MKLAVTESGVMKKRVLAICFGKYLYGGLVAVLLLRSSFSFSAVPTIEIEIRDHLFFPSEVNVPRDTKVRLLITNRDATPEEFESYELNREKVISGDTKTVIFIGPLPPGVYPFFGEFYPKTAQGTVVVE